MKRMYVVLSVIILLSAWMLQALGQKLSGAAPLSSREDQLKRRLQLREEMHQRMIEKLMHGHGPDEGLFSDMEEMMNEAMSDSFMGIRSLSEGTSTFKMDWSETKTGRTLVILPQDPAQKIDLDVKDDVITVKGETKSQSENGTSVSHFTNSFPVPQDCDGSKVKIKNVEGKIVMEFPFRKGSESRTPKPIQKDSRVPIDPLGDEVTI